MGLVEGIDGDLKLYDIVRTPTGAEGIISAIVHCYEGMPYTVAFPDGSFDVFNGCDLEVVGSLFPEGLPK